MAANRSKPSTPDSEQAFLAAYDASRFPRPSVAVDLVLMTVEEGRLKALLLRRAEHPAKGRWSLPGGFVGIDEPLDAAADRIVHGKAGLSGVFVEQLYTFGSPGRDPRTRVISVAHFALVPAAKLREVLTARTAEPLALAPIRVPWEGEEGGPVEALGPGGDEPLALAFDHAEMLGTAVKRLRGRLSYSPVGYELLPGEFTLRALQTIHEAVLSRKLNKDAFRRRILASGEVEPTGRLEGDVGHRPAELYRYRRPQRPHRRGGRGTS